jgi:hypothetical protein
MNELRRLYYVLHRADEVLHCVVGYLISFQQKGSFILEKKTYSFISVSITKKTNCFFSDDFSVFWTVRM